MEVEMGKLNGFFIDATLKWGTASPYDIFTNATEDEFKAVLESIYHKTNLKTDLILVFKDLEVMWQKMVIISRPMEILYCPPMHL